MKKRLLTSTLALLLAGFTVFISCSELIPAIADDDNGYIISDPARSEESSEPIEARNLSELERDILYFELLVLTESTAENHFHLASLYREAGMIRMQRDALERSFRLNQDYETFQLLQSIVVNIYEESTLLQEKVWNLKDFLGDRDNQARAIELVTSEEWFAVMMPNLSEGKRNYYFEDASDGSTIYFEVGFDKLNENKPYTKAWYETPTDNNVVYLFQSGNMFQLLETAIVDGSFDGDFSLWLCVVNSDTIYHDTGTFNQGVIVGDFVSRVYSNSDATDLVSLFTYRNDVEYEIYLGNFDENGATTVAQPQRATGSQIAYALSEDGRRFLFHTIQEDEEREGFKFDYAFLGLTIQPDFEPYTPAPAQVLQGSVTLDLSEVQIRIFDSVIQWFDGENWHVMGGVMELLAQDPFQSLLITTANASAFSGVAITSGNGGIASPWINRGGSTEVEPPRATPTSERNADTGSETPAGGYGGYVDSGDWSAPQTPPPSTPQAPPLPEGGNETNIDWTDTFT